jgi:hypothetical protein
MAGIGRLKNKIAPETKSVASKSSLINSKVKTKIGEKVFTSLHPLKKGKRPLASQSEARKKQEVPSAVPVSLQSVPVGPPPQKPSSTKDKRPLASQSEAAKNQKAPSAFVSSPSVASPKKPLSPKDRLYEKILLDSQKEKLGQQQFIARVQGKSEGENKAPSQPDGKKEKVIFRPVPQKPSRGRKIVIRILIVLLIASLGLLLYIIAHGYLI